MIASGPDLLRLALIPAFLWLALVDFRTRRIPRWVWWPIGAVGLIALVWAGMVMAHLPPLQSRVWTIQVAISLGLVAPLGYLFYRFGAYGAADAKAVIVIAIAYPTYPLIKFGTVSLPLVELPTGLFSLTVLVNAVLLGLVYPLALAGRNAVNGDIRTAMFVGLPVHWSKLPERHGVLLEHDNALPRSGLDLDALRMYLQWRKMNLAELRADPYTYVEPSSLPDEPAKPGDGAVRTDGGIPQPDRWGARAFLDDVGGAYGTRPEELRIWLDRLTEREVFWVSPGIPFLVLLVGGLVVGLIFGDLFTMIVSHLGM